MSEEARKATAPVLEHAITPQLVHNGVVEVCESNTAWDARNSILHSFFTFNATNAPASEIVREHGETGNLLRLWSNAHTAGNLGDFYDNRDSGHSDLNCGLFPQLTRIKYASEAIQTHAHYGLADLLFFNGVVFGNSSTAQVEHAVLAQPDAAGLRQPAADHPAIYAVHEQSSLRLSRAQRPQARSQWAPAAATATSSPPTRRT